VEARGGESPAGGVGSSERDAEPFDQLIDMEEATELEYRDLQALVEELEEPEAAEEAEAVDQ